MSQSNYALQTKEQRENLTNGAEEFKETEKFMMHTSTLNCGGETPDNYLELLPIFTSSTMLPDIYVIALQEIVKLDAFQILKGKSKKKVD